MLNVRFVFCALIAAAISMTFWACTNAHEKVIRIYGSTTTEPLLQAIADAYSSQNQVRIEIVPTGSHKGIEALVGGRCELAASSVPIPASELGKNACGYREFVFGYDMIVPIVHPGNPLSDLSLAQLQELFSGKINRWSQIGGPDLPVVIVNRSRNSGTHDIWDRVVAPAPNGLMDEVVQTSNSAVLAYVAEHPAAIGYISSGFVNQEIKPLSVNGIEASVSNARTRRYPLFRGLLLYAPQERLTWEVKSFIIYLLSDEGQKWVEKAGFVPVNVFEWKEGTYPSDKGKASSAHSRYISEASRTWSKETHS